MTKRLQTFQTTFGVFFFFIPLFLMIATGEVRPSISNYAYSSQANLFVALLSLAGFVFIIDAWMNGKWWNFLIGGALIGVALTPHLDYGVAHYSCASAFFLGSVCTMIAYSSAKQRFYKIIAGVVIVSTLAIALITNSISLLYAEWIGMLPISVHLIGEAYGIID